MRDGGRVLGGNDPRGRSVAWRAVGHGGFGSYGQRRLEEVLEGLRMRRGRGELGPGRDLRKSGVRLTVSSRGFVLVVPGCAVMVVFPILDGRFVEGGLLQGGMHPIQPGQGRNGLGEYHHQRQDVRGRRPQWPGIGKKDLMGWPS